MAETIDGKTGETITNTGAEDNGGDVALHAETGLVAQITKVEIDTAIATARQYPRSIEKARKEIMGSIVSEDIAEECIYALPRGQKHIRGPSIRFAEIAVAAYGNCESGARTTHIGDEFVEAEGVFRDYQNNVRKVRRVRRRITDSKGRRYNNDMILMTCNAACAIAERNSILSGIPKAVWGESYEKAFGMAGGTIATIDSKRERAMAAFATLGVKPEQVFSVLEIKGASELSPDHIITMRGMIGALRSGEETLATMFSVRNLTGKDFETVKDPLKDQPQNGQPQAGQPQFDPKAGFEKVAASADPASGQQTAQQSPPAESQRSADPSVPTVKSAAEYIETVGKPFLASATSGSKIDDWWRKERQSRIALKFTAEDTNTLEDLKETRKGELTAK